MTLHDHNPVSRYFSQVNISKRYILLLSNCS